MPEIRIAVVHRDPRFRELFAAACQPPSFCAQNFAMASTLLALVSDLCPDCVVSELQPIDMDAERFIRELRERRGLGVPLLILAPPNAESRARPLLTAGADACLSEPFSVRDVLDRVRSLLSGRQRPSSAPQPAARSEVERPLPSAARRPATPASLAAVGAPPAESPARRQDLWSAEAPGLGHFTRVEIRGRPLIVLTEASLRPFVITTVVTEGGSAIRRIQTELPHGLARTDDAHVVREQVKRQHEAALDLIDDLALEPRKRHVVWPRSKTPRSAAAG